MRQAIDPGSPLQALTSLQIAILHYTVPPIIGGVEATIAAQARLLRAHGHTVQLFAGRGDDARLIPELDSRHPRVQAVQRELSAGRVSSAFDALAADLAQALDHALGATTVVLAHNVTTLHKNLALTAALHQLARAQRVRVLAWCHDFAWEDPVYAHELRPGYPWDLLRTPWPQARYVVVSDARRGDLARLLGLDPQAIVVIPPGIDAAEFFQVSPMTTQWLDELHLLDAAPLLLLPARITRRKNIELAIDVVAALHTRGWNATLLVMGPLGPHNPSNQEYLELLQARAARVGPTPQNPDTAPAVIFLQAYGPVGDAERRDLYALSDALFFPSAREGFGIPILEAGLARLPIFCADIPPFRESAHADAHYFGLNDPPTQIAARLADFFAADARYQLKRRIVTEYAWSALYRSRLAPLLELMV